MLFLYESVISGGIVCFISGSLDVFESGPQEDEPGIWFISGGLQNDEPSIESILPDFPMEAGSLGIMGYILGGIFLPAGLDPLCPFVFSPFLTTVEGDQCAIGGLGNILPGCCGVLSNLLPPIDGKSGNI